MKPKYLDNMNKTFIGHVNAHCNKNMTKAKKKKLQQIARNYAFAIDGKLRKCGQ